MVPWLILLAEVLFDTQSIVLSFNALVPLLLANHGPREKMQLVGHRAPKIAVLIPCCGESHNLIINTVRAAVSQDYPMKQLTIYVLDDGDDATLKGEVEKLQDVKDVPKLRYLCRKSNAFFKAGNLNFGIMEATKENAPDFVASLDADMIPHQLWLRRMIPHLLLGNEIALACPPQTYYNTPMGDILAQEADLDMWFHHLEYLNDAIGAAMCTGSGFIVRATALTSIGGWPLTEAGEDYMCSSVLNAVGWQTIFVPEPDLQLGQCPNSLSSHISQRQRWVDSGLAVHKYFRYWISKRCRGKMTKSQLLVRLLQLARELAPLGTLFSYLVLPWTLASLRATSLGKETSQDCLTITLYAYLGYTILSLFVDRLVYGHLGYRKFILLLALDVWSLPYVTPRILSNLVPRISVMIPRFEFRSSGSIQSALNERSETHRASLGQRCGNRVFLLHSFVFTLVFVPTILILISISAGGSDGFRAFFLMPGALMKLLDLLWKSSVPLIYLIFPPTVGEWKEATKLEDWGRAGNSFFVRTPKGLKSRVSSAKIE